MKISNNGLTLIKKFEKFMPEVYKDPVGIPTIGYGHVIKKSDDPSLETAVLTEEEATELMIKDLAPFENNINEVCEQYDVNLNQNQFDAMCSFCFNLGFINEVMRKRFENKDIKAIGDSMILYVYASGKRLPGLVKRRKAEQDLFFS